MPRKHRIVSSDGIYHVINRGNYRSFIFEGEGEKASFEECLFEACGRFSWEMQAYCIMSNHFHLCLATPAGNLSEGMRWLQATFAMRFNRFRKEKGHLFQGRFKSLIVEPGERLISLVNYIHLNPVRAGMVSIDGLRGYRWTSLALLPKIKARPQWLDSSWMDYSDALEDSRIGWNRYLKLLGMRASDDPSEIDRIEREMNRGWCIGSKPFKKAVSQDLLERDDAIHLEADALKAFNRNRWEAKLERSLELLDKTDSDIASSKKTEVWKVAIAAKLKRESSATNAWISEKLSMGSPNAVSDYCGKYVRKHESECSYAKKLRTEP